MEIPLEGVDRDDHDRRVELDRDRAEEDDRGQLQERRVETIGRSRGCRGAGAHRPRR
jgi:hypothetical protein